MSLPSIQILRCPISTHMVQDLLKVGKNHGVALKRPIFLYFSLKLEVPLLCFARLIEGPGFGKAQPTKPWENHNTWRVVNKHAFFLCFPSLKLAMLTSK